MGRILLETLTVVQVFMEHQGSLPCPQEPATCSVLLLLPYPEPDKSYTHPQKHNSLNIHFNTILLPSTSWYTTFSLLVDCVFRRGGAKAPGRVTLAGQALAEEPDELCHSRRTGSDRGARRRVLP
jgi:hypothetical protein